MSREAACAELRATAGSQVDPQVVEVFVNEIANRSVTAVDLADRPVQAVAERVRNLLAAG